MTESRIQIARKLREKFQKDPHRPKYHFTTPEGLCMPFDPNGAIFWKGKYHLFYIFQDEALPHGGHCWGHASSVDLVHWTFHPTALAPAPGDPDVGIFSGGAFVNKDGVPTIIYHGVGAGTCIATSQDDDLVNWTKCPANPVVPEPKEGDEGYGVYNVFDPCCWVEGDTYYAILGGMTLPGRAGDTAFLFKSTDLIRWQYVHPFYESDRRWTDPAEDCACPDFFKLGDTHMLLFISHYAGAQYYLGRYENEKFYPQRHGRMNWPGGPCFAPESLLDDKGRRIFWAWACEARTLEAQRAADWSGVMTLPRVLSPADDGTLRIEPPVELEMLRLNHRKREDISLGPNSQLDLDDMRGDCLELALEIRPDKAQEFGLKLRRSPDGAEETAVVYDPAEKSLKVDATKSSLSKDVLQPFPQPFAAGGSDPLEGRKNVLVQSTPFELSPGEPLSLRIFLDRSIVEVFANARQCLTQRIYPSRSDSLGVVLFSGAAGLNVRSLEAWDMAAAGN